MSYSGTTAASSLANPPRKLIEGVATLAGTTGLTTAPAAPGGQGGALWYYSSTNLTTDVTASNFFTDGKQLGMKPGDVVFDVQFSSAGSSVELLVGVITGVSTSGATLSTGGAMTSTFA